MECLEWGGGVSVCAVPLKAAFHLVQTGVNISREAKLRSRGQVRTKTGVKCVKGSSLPKCLSRIVQTAKALKADVEKTDEINE